MKKPAQRSTKTESKRDTKLSELHRQAVQVREKAHAPYSHFQVGAALLAVDGTVYTGCNVENASYGATICAERTAILKAVSSGHKDFTDIVVVTDLQNPVGPCALCLQVLVEFCKPDMRVWIGDKKQIKAEFQLENLLPQPFGAKELKGKKPSRTSHL